MKVESDLWYYATDRMAFLVCKTFPKNSWKITGHHNKDQEWNYTTRSPDVNWTQMAYDSNSWSKGKAGFGAGMPPDLTLSGQLMIFEWEKSSK